MQKERFISILTDSSTGKCKDNRFDYKTEEKASLLLSFQGPIFMVEDIRRIEIKESYALIRTEKEDLYYLDIDTIVGFKLQRSKKEGAGFLS